MLTFADYMNRVLYGPAGYYSTGIAQSGKSGDYFTAPDVGPVFGRLLAGIFAGWEEKLNAGPMTLIEAGAGEGRLAQDLLKSRPFRYIAVEKSPVRRARLESLDLKVVADLSALKDQPLQGILFGNELLDAFPVHRVRSDKGRLRELWVDEAGEKRRFFWGDPSSPKLKLYFERLGIELPDGYETEVNLGMAAWLKEASAVLEKGLVLLIDYGRPAYEYYAPERTRGTLRAFSKHKVSADFLDPSAMVDLTADVDFTSVCLDARAAGFTPLAFMEMGTFLMQGLERMKDPSTLPPAGLKYLLHPEGMGSAFHVVILGKGIAETNWVFEHNRLSRLGLPKA